MLVVALFAYGLIIGSFLNALLWRTKTDRSIAKGRSLCPTCKHELAPVDLVPVLSWLALKGRCRYCRKPISWQYPAVELLAGTAFALSYLAFRPDSLSQWLGFGVWLYFVAVLIFLAVYDLRWMILPDKVLLPAIMVALAAIVLRPQFLVPHLMVAVAVGGSFYLLASIAGGKLMGGGDVKLVFLLALLLGPAKTLLVIVLAFNLAAVIGVALILAKKRGRRDLIPFGPFLAGAGFVGYLYGDSLIASYLKVAGLS